MTTLPIKLFGALLFALSLLVPLISATAADFKYCNKKTNYIVKVNEFDINPYPISRSKETTFTISATTAEPISGGKFVIDVTYFGFHVHGEEHDLCKETTCPIAVGDFVVSNSQALPGITPPGSYSLKMTLVDGNKKQLTCINFDFSIGFLAEEETAVL